MHKKNELCIKHCTPCYAGAHKKSGNGALRSIPKNEFQRC